MNPRFGVGQGKSDVKKKGPGLEVKEVLLQPTIKGPISNPGQAVATDSWTWSGATLGPSGHTRSTPTGFRCMGLTLSPTRNLFIGNWKRTGFGDPGFGSDVAAWPEASPKVSRSKCDACGVGRGMARAGSFRGN